MKSSSSACNSSGVHLSITLSANRSGRTLEPRESWAHRCSVGLAGCPAGIALASRRHPMNRRGFLQLIGATGAAALTSSCNRINSEVGTPSSPPNLIRFPEKTEMILLTDRPPQLETPLHYFRQDLTPNEAFFVRWHLE